MKQLLLFSFLVLAGLHANSQSLVMDNRPVQKTVIVPSSEGKYNVYTGHYGTESTPLVQFAPGCEERTFNPADRSDRSPDLQTFHVTFHFDNQPSNFFLLRSDMVYTSFWDFTPVNDTMYEGDVLEGEYYMITEFLIYNMSVGMYTAYHVLQQDFHVYQDMDTTILSSAADNFLDVQLQDENGSDIPPSNMPDNDQAFYYTFPESANLGEFCFLYWIPVEQIYTNGLPSGMQMRLTKTAIVEKSNTDDGLYHRYVVNFPFITGLQQDTVLTNDPLEYGIFPHVMHSSPAAVEGYFGFMFGVMQNPMWYDVMVMSVIYQSPDYPKEGSDTCIVFESGNTDPSDKLFFITYMASWEQKPNSTEACKYHMYSATSYLSAEGEMVHSEGVYYPPSIFDYRIPESTTVDIGNNAPYVLTVCYNEQNSNELLMYVGADGQVNEVRSMDYVTGSYDIWQGDQYIGSGPVVDGEIHRWVDYPAEYMVRAVDSNYRILGKTGKVTSDMYTNLLAPDPNPPFLTFFRILQGDRISQELIHGFESSLLLRAGDRIPGSYYLSPPESAHAYFKRSSDTTWIELSLVPVTSLGDSLLGMPYTADLGPVLDEYIDSTWVDIRLELTDLAGNSVVQTMSPAFFVRDMGVGTGPEVPQNVLSYYPNPARDQVTVIGAPGQVEVTLYSVIGERVLFTQADRTVNVSALPRGLYLITLKDLTTGEISAGKLAIVR